MTNACGYVGDEIASRMRRSLVELHNGFEHLEVGCFFTLDTAAPTTAFLRVRPSDHVAFAETLVVDGAGGAVASASAIEPLPASLDERQVVETLTLPAGRSSVRYSAFLDVAPVCDLMPDHAAAPRVEALGVVEWWWLQPTRYCRPDELGGEAWERFGVGIGPGSPATGALVREICSYVNESMAFEYGSSTPMTSATDAWAARRGVCRDFNHIAISFCRALNIPARYAFGYLPDITVDANTAPMDFCAWFEVLLDGRWWTFDARVNEPRIGRVVVGRGRDAGDVPLVSTFGPAFLSEFRVFARQAPVLAAPEAAEVGAAGCLIR